MSKSLDLLTQLLSEDAPMSVGALASQLSRTAAFLEQIAIIIPERANVGEMLRKEAAKLNSIVRSANGPDSTPPPGPPGPNRVKTDQAPPGRREMTGVR